ARRLCRTVGALLPGRRLRMGRGSRPAALCHQCAELRPLQNLRYQRPQPEHHLGAARRRRRPELSEYVISKSRMVSSEVADRAPFLFANRPKKGWPGRRGAGGELQPRHAPAPILPPLGPNQPSWRENDLGASGSACLRACAKKYILAATEHNRRADSRSAGPVFAYGDVVIHSLLPRHAAILGLPLPFHFPP